MMSIIYTYLINLNRYFAMIKFWHHAFLPLVLILGPLLYIIYTSDDTQLYYSFSKENVEDANTVINRGIISSSITFANKLFLTNNASRSSILLFSNANRRIVNELREKRRLNLLAKRLVEILVYF